MERATHSSPKGAEGLVEERVVEVLSSCHVGGTPSHIEGSVAENSIETVSFELRPHGEPVQIPNSS